TELGTSHRTHERRTSNAEPRTAMTITLDGHSLTLDDLVVIAHANAPVALSEAARDRVRAARDVVDEFAQHDAPTYGINTGFGSFADVSLTHESPPRLQGNTLRTH